MYNRYAPREGWQDSMGEEAPRGPAGSSLLSALKKLLGNEKNAGGTGILEKLGIGQLDQGDILLLLVLVYLFWESEDEEWLVILALVLLMLLSG